MISGVTNEHIAIEVVNREASRETPAIALAKEVVPSSIRPPTHLAFEWSFSSIYSC